MTHAKHCLWASAAFSGTLEEPAAHAMDVGLTILSWNWLVELRLISWWWLLEPRLIIAEFASSSFVLIELHHHEY